MQKDIFTKIACVFTVLVFLSNDVIASARAVALMRSGTFTIENVNEIEIKPTANNLVETKSIKVSETKEEVVYAAASKTAYIGVHQKDPLQSPGDDIFTIDLENKVESYHYAYLKYEVKGIANPDALPKAINQGEVYVGEELTHSNNWKKTTVLLDKSDLTNNLNQVRFAIPKKTSLGVEVRNVEIHLSNKSKSFSKGLKMKREQANAEDFKVVLEEGAEISSLITFENRDIEMASVPKNIRNLTRNAWGYGARENQQAVRKVSIAVDSKKLLSPKKLKQASIFYYDKEQHSWKQVQPSKVDMANMKLEASVPGNTDYFAGLIKTPDMPEASAYLPTGISGLEAASPAAGITMIAPPQQSRTGEARVSYPLNIPAGRQGLAPSLSVNYNSDAGTGWMGIGWNVAMPSVSVDTRWGVPKFSDDYQSEVYNLNGESLTQEDGTKANRAKIQEGQAVFSPIKGEQPVHFFTKTMSSYKKIERVGDSPRDYVWIETLPNKTKYYYGTINGSDVDDQSVLKDPATDNIVKWCLTKVEDQWGNFMEYHYTTATINGNDNELKNGGITMIPEKIVYTGHGTTSGKYEIRFSASTDRRDATINMKYGFKLVDNHTLDQISAWYNNAKVRSYKMNYIDEGQFFKTKLESIAEHGENDEFFYNHTFTYHQNNLIYGPEEEFDVNHFSSNIYDDFDGDMSGITTALRNILYPSPIKTTSTLGFSAGGGFGIGGFPIGFGKFFKDKKLKVSGNFDYSESHDKDRVNLQDMNGDGLPDIVYDRLEGRGFFAMQNNGNGLELGPFIEIKNTDKLFRSRSFTRSYGFDFTGLTDATIYFGKDWSYGTNEVKSYLTDYNSDGFADLVFRDGDGTSKVKFGKMDGKDEYVFVPNSANTPNPVIKGATLANSSTHEEYKDIETVKSWTAPFSGTVNISGTAKRVGATIGETKVAVQKNESFIGPGFTTVNASSTVSTNYNSISVSKGDILMFRAKSVDDGQQDLLTWNPAVQYTGETKLDGNEIAFTSTNYEEAFLLSGAEVISMTDKEKIKVELQRSVSEKLTDDVVFVMKVDELNTDGNIENQFEYTNTLDHGTSSFINNLFYSTSGTSINLGAPAGQFLPNAQSEKDYHISFALFSTSNVNWRAVKFRPIVTIYGEDNCESEKVLYPVIDYGTYNRVEQMQNAYYTEASIDEELNYRMWPEFEYSGSAFEQLFSAMPGNKNQLTAYFTVKEQGALSSKMALIFDQASSSIIYKDCNDLGAGTNTLNTTTSPSIYSLDNPKLEEGAYLEFFAEDPFYSEEVAKFIGKNLNNIWLQEYEGGEWNDVDRASESNVFFQKSSWLGDKLFHWGQFAWSYDDATPLNEEIHPSDLKPATQDFATNNPFNSESNPSSSFFDQNENTLNPLDQNFFMLQALRGEKDFMLRTYEESSYSDLSTAGLLSTTVSNKEENLDRYSFMGTHISIFASSGMASPGKWGEPEEENLSGISSVPNSLYNASATSLLSQSKSSSTTITGILKGYDKVGISSNVSDDSKWYNWSVSQFQDYNGDGYPDKINYDENSNNTEAIFTNPLGGHESTSSTLNNGLLSKTYPLNVSASYAGHFVSKEQVEPSNKKKNRFTHRPGISASVGSNYELLFNTDLNGDGLPDRVSRSSSDHDNVHMALGYGNGFESPEELTASAPETRPRSKNWGASLGYNLEFLKTGTSKLGGSFSAGISINRSLNYQNITFIDINGDGLKDIIEKDPTIDGRHEIFINTGTGWESYNVSSLALDENVNESNSSSFNAMAGGSYNFTIPTPIVGVELSAVVTASLSGRTAVNGMNSSFIDMNGDGVLDYVTEGSYGDLLVRYAQLNENNLLETVTNPLGGSFTIEYNRVGNKNGYYAAEIKHHENTDQKLLWDMPNSKWVMSELTVNDGYDVQHGGLSVDGEEEVKTWFAYDGGIHSRREREFLGFTRLEKKFAPGANDLERNHNQATTFEATNSGDYPKIYITEVSQFMAPLQSDFAYRKRFEYQAGILVEKNTYYNRIDRLGGGDNPYSYTYNMYPINLNLYDYDFRYVNINSGTETFNQIYSEGSGQQKVEWTTVDETSSIYPALTDITTVNYPDVINPANRVKYYSQKFTIEYDDLWNITKYENEGELKDRVYGKTLVENYTRTHYDYITESKTLSDGTVRLDLSDEYFNVYEFICDENPSYSSYIMYVPKSADACYGFIDLEEIGDDYPIVSQHKKLVAEEVEIWKSTFNDVFENKIIAVMDYFDPVLANEQTNALKHHTIYKNNIAESNILRESKVKTLYQGKTPSVIINYLDGDEAESSITYFNNGNVKQVTAPENYDGDAIVVDFEYDTEVDQFVTSVTNQAYNETSKFKYDIATGNLLKTLDVNGQAMRYQYDQFYRLEKVWAPREYYTSGSAPTIIYEYDINGHDPNGSLEETVPFAITTHNLNTAVPSGTYTVPSAYASINDLNEAELNNRPAISNSIKTATFLDGIGRAIQMKKEAPLVDGNDNSVNNTVLQVSGMATYDQWGMVEERSDMVQEITSNSSDIEVLHLFDSELMQQINYDYQGRVTQEASLVGDGTQALFTTSYTYGWMNHTDGKEYAYSQVSGVTTNQTLIDSRGRTIWSVQVGNNEQLETQFQYDVLNQLLNTTNPLNQVTTYEYDNFGRTIEEDHPDRGVSNFTYDLVGNLTNMVTPGTGSSGITYDYNHTRLTDKFMPNGPDELYDISYVYGSLGDGKNGAGRIVSVKQGAPDNGGNRFKQDFYKYDELGNLVYEEKQIDIPQHQVNTYTTEYSYDSWGRILQMIYPDQEEVSYSYTNTGDLYSISTQKIDEPSSESIIDHITYDGFGNMSFMKYGNQAEIAYNYNNNTRTFSTILHKTNPIGGSGTQVNGLATAYLYEFNGRIQHTLQTNSIPDPISGEVNKGNLYTHQYDPYNRLESTTGTFNYRSSAGVNSTKSFSLVMDYNKAGGIISKTQSLGSDSYDLSYSYDNTKKHRLTSVSDAGGETITYGYGSSTEDMGSVETMNSTANGNTTFSWNEEQWLTGVNNTNGYHHYVYDHTGNRIMKASLTASSTANNGQNNPGLTDLDPYTVYVSPYYIATSYDDYEDVSKHYYIGAQRIATEVITYVAPIPGGGITNPNPESEENSNLTTPQLNEKQISPVLRNLSKVLTKFELEEGIDYHMEDLKQSHYLAEYREIPSSTQNTNSNKTEAAGDEDENYYYHTHDRYWYHSNYLGSNDMITDEAGEMYHYYTYSPFGENLYEWQKDIEYSNILNWEFNGKEADGETGNMYYGARYYDPKISMWLSVDPMSAAAPHLTPYRAFLNNPIHFTDPTGLLESTHTDEDGNVIAVYDDDDNGVYKHQNGVTKADLDKEHSTFNTGVGGEKMGKTEYWDEFVNPETGETMTQYRIYYGTSFDPIIDKKSNEAKGQGLMKVMLESVPNGDYDIKVPYKNTGALLNGKYATSRSAGNYLAGKNAAVSRLGGAKVSFDAFQNMAGALHQGGKKGLLKTLLYGKKWGEAPTYGEEMYQYRMSKAGWLSSGRNLGKIK